MCGGIGRYLGVDPVLLRIAFIVLALANGLGVIAEEVAGRPSPRSGPASRWPRPPSLGGSLAGWCSAAPWSVPGLVLLVDRLAPNLDELFWPVAVVAVGVAVMLVGLRR